MAVDALNNLKAKAADEFWQLLCKVRKGHRVNYDFIMDEITLIDLVSEHALDNKLEIAAIEYYLNSIDPILYQ